MWQREPPTVTSRPARIAARICAISSSLAGAGDGGADGGEASIFPPNSGLAAAGDDPALVTEVKAMIAACGPKRDAAKGWPSDCKKTWNE